MTTLEQRRAEILVALGTAIVTMVIAVIVIFEALRRIRNPPTVESIALLGVAAISAGIVLFTLWRTSRWLRRSVEVLFEHPPADVNLAVVREVLATTPGVIDVHDLHVWSLDSGVKAMTAHVVIPDFEDRDDMMSLLRERAAGELGILHVTIQIESSSWEPHETHL